MDIFDDDPFIPIVVSKIGEAIRPDNFGMSDSDTFYKAQRHIKCDSIVVIKRVSDTHQVLWCQGCGMRRFFPLEATTYGALRNHFETVLNEGENEAPVVVERARSQSHQGSRKSRSTSSRSKHRRRKAA